MFLELDIAVNELGTLTDRERLAIEQVGVAIFRGRHAAKGSPELLTAFVGFEWLSDHARAAFKTLRATAPQLGAMPLPRRSWIIRRGVLHPLEQQGKWIVGLDALADNGFGSEPELLGENVRDAKLYLRIARRFRRTLGYGALDVFYRPMGGGGSMTPVEFQERLDQNRLVVCVVDSDRTHARDGLGEVASRALQVLPADTDRACLHVLGVRNIENLFPLDWISRTQVGMQAVDTLDALREAEQKNLLELRSFVYLKGPLRGCDIYSKPDKFLELRPEIEQLDRVIANGGVPRCTPSCDKDSCTVFLGFGAR